MATTDKDFFIDLPEESKQKTKETVIQAIGVGGGGGNAVGNMYLEDIPGVRFLACNTDAKQLSDCAVPNKLLLGEGLGAGGRPELGRQLAEESIESIRQHIHDDTDILFVTAGMGGGTGTGGAPIVAREAKAKGILTVGIVTIPFLYEKAPQIDKALDGVEEMQKYVDALLIINNERLRLLYGQLSICQGLRMADKTLTKAVQTIVEIINMRGISNLDFRDIDTCLRNGGVAVMSHGTGTGENRVEAAIEQALYSPLLNKTDIFQSKSIRFAIFFPKEGKNAMRMEETEEITRFMSKFQSEIDTKFGWAEDENLTDEVRVTLLAAGFHHPHEEADEDPEKRTRRLRAYDGLNLESPVLKRHHRIHIFQDKELGNDELIYALEESPTAKRSAAKAQEIKQISENKRQVSDTITTRTIE